MERAQLQAEQHALTLGVAGHVDHGKTSFVRALTGVDTDALAEEQRRGISIELGFAPLALEPGAPPVGLVDMPGHERFVRRMISGAAGVDAVLLIIAADEGVMPQGREHLAICELLGITRGAVVLTKVDLADELLLELVQEDVAELLAGTPLEGAPTLHFSAMEPERWLPDVRRQLGALTQGWRAERAVQRERRAQRPFRMPVDRSFVRSGRGTIVTGTAATGRVALDDQVTAWPAGDSFRVRGVQRHGAAVPGFTAPGRVALDLAGAALDDVPVGTVLAAEGAVVQSDRIDAQLRVLGHLRKPLKPRFRALVHIGTTHVEGSVVQLSGEGFTPGEATLAQIHLDRPLAIAPGEHFVVRGSAVDPRHGQTIAGGRVLAPAPPRHRLGDPAVLEALGAIAGDDDVARVAAAVALARGSGKDTAELALALDLAPSRLDRAVRGALSKGLIRRFGSGARYLAPAEVDALEARAIAAVDEAHRAHPDRAAIDEAELARRVGAWLDPDMVGGLVHGLTRRGALVRVGGGLARPGFKPKLLTARPAVHEALDAALAGSGLAPPIGNALREAVSARCPVSAEELELAIKEGVAAGRLVHVRAGFVLPASVVATMVGDVLRRFADEERFTTGDLKTLLGLTRKHLIPIAELLDNARITIRDPDGNRRFRQRALQRWQEGKLPWEINATG